MNLTDNELLVVMKNLRERECLAIADVVLYLAEIDKRKLYRDAGCSSLFSYCREVLKYSEGATHRRIQAARIYNEQPEIYEKLKSGALSLCAIAEIARVKEMTVRAQVFVAAEGKGKQEVQRIVAPLLPAEKSTKPQVRVKSVEVEQKREERFHITMEVDKEFMELYEEAKRLTGTVDIREVIKGALKTQVMKHKPKEMPIRAKKTESRVVAKSVRNAVIIRDGEQCTYCSKDGVRCRERVGLEIDHVIPFGKGGRTEVRNLRVLCRSHNQLEAERWYGKEFMQNHRHREGRSTRGKVI